MSTLTLPREAIDWCLEAFRLDGETVVWARDTTRGIKAGDPVGTKIGKGYLRVNVNTKPRKAISIHRLKWLLRHGSLPPDDLVIDPIDRNKMNNDFANLRLVTRSQNIWNSEYCKGGTPRGVQVVRDKYVAAITANGERMYLGFFAQIEDAIAARTAAERQHHGEYAACQQ
jgi:hypothetical protein